MLLRVQPGVYLLAGSPACYEQRVLAPLLAVRGLAAVSHRSAARLLGLRGNATYGEVHITVPTATRARVTRARLHQSLVLDRHDVQTTRDGLTITRPERTVIGYGASAPGAAGRAVDAAIHGGLTTYDRCGGISRGMEAGGVPASRRSRRR